MNHLCVVSDYNFLPKGLALYDSLLKKSKDFVLHYLCFDERSYEKLLPYECDTLKVYSDSFQDPVLEALKVEDRKYYSYTLASYFSRYLMEKNKAPVTYIDSDIYFHQSINGLLDKIGSRHIGIFRHRQYSMQYQNGNGWFNVGVVHFKNTDIGKEYLDWWSDAVLHRKYPDLATCGDQKYLDVFAVLPEHFLFIDGDVGHGAPWQWMMYDFDSYAEDGCITWGDKKQELVFSHFSQFEYSVNDDTYNPSTMHHCFTPAEMYYSNAGLKKIYDDYFEEIKKVHAKYLF